MQNIHHIVRIGDEYLYIPFFKRRAGRAIVSSLEYIEINAISKGNDPAKV